MENLDTSSGHEAHRSIFAVSGPAGAGKSYLLRSFLGAAKHVDASTAWTDQTETEVLGTLRALASQLDGAQPFAEFHALDQKHANLVAKLVATPDAPDDLSFSLGRGISRGALALGREIPGLGVPLEFVDDEALASGTQKVIAYVRSAVESDEDFALLLSPIDKLTRSFMGGLRNVAENEQPVALFFDAFQRTSHFLEAWLLDVVGEHYGKLPPAVTIVVGGQRPLSRVKWSLYEALMRRVELDVFTEDEASQVLNAAGITDPELAAHLQSLSGRLPVLLTMLASQAPQTIDAVELVPSDAIEVFLNSVTDRDLRTLAIDGALPRVLNEDLLPVAVGAATTSAQWLWLCEQTFIQEARAGWRYHEVARRLLLHYKLRESPAEWEHLHSRLMDHFHARQGAITGASKQKLQEERWRGAYTEYLYHRLCAHPEHLAWAVVRCLRGSEVDRAFGLGLAYAISDAGEDADNASVARWGSSCKELLESSDPRIRLRVLDRLLAWDAESIVEARAYLRRRRGMLLSDMGRYEDAVTSLRGAITLRPDRTSYYADLAVVHARAEKWGLGVAAVDEGLAQIDAADEAMVSHLLCIRARLQLDDEQTAEALEDADRAVDLPNPTAEAYHVRGVVHEALDEPDLALADFEQGIAISPSYEHQGLQEIGSLLARISRLDDAERTLVRSLELSPDCGHCWTALVRVARERDPGVTPNLSAYGLDEQMSPEGLFHRSRALGSAGFVVAAVVDFDRVFGTEPGRIPYSALNDYGLWLTYLDRMADAKAVYRECLRRRPGNAVTLYNLAVATAYADGVATAQDEITDARAALFALPAESEMTSRVYGLAGLAAVENEYDEAFKLLTDAFAIRPDVVADWATKDCAWRELATDPRFARALSSEPV